MRRFRIGLALAFAFAPILMPPPADAQQGGWGQMGPNQRQHMQRDWAYMNQDAPASYHNAKSPVQATPEMVAAGARLYGENCAGCHGKDGRGRGRYPGLLNYLVQTPDAEDENLFGVISKGRRRMPAFKRALQEDEIRKIIAFMRAGFPSVDPA